MPERSWYERLARSESGSLRAILREYYQSFEEVESIYHFPEALESEKAGYLDLISKLIADQDTNRFLRAEYDFDNLLFLWKARFLEVDSEEDDYSSCGLIDPELLEDAVDNGSGVFLPEYLKGIFDYLDSVSGREGFEAAQAALEREKYSFLLDIAPSAGAERYIRMRIDMLNIKNFIRLKRSSLFSFELEHWVPGGEIDILTLRQLFAEPEDELYSYLSYSPYSRLSDRSLGTDTPLWEVDPLLSGEIYYYLSGERHSFFDMVPVIYHLENMYRNFSALRSVITGSINRLPEEIILDMLESVMPSG